MGVEGPLNIRRPIHFPMSSKQIFNFPLSLVWLTVTAVKGRELSAFCNAAVAQVPERLISSFTKLKQLISSSRECLALSILIRHLVIQSSPLSLLPIAG
ncbi:hypothetical protein OIU84_003745 [Salix udensis]|nr:hypothetical protein OIU84_003745 [Salix udensis]